MLVAQRLGSASILKRTFEDLKNLLRASDVDASKPADPDCAIRVVFGAQASLRSGLYRRRCSLVSTAINANARFVGWHAVGGLILRQKRRIPTLMSLMSLLSLLLLLLLLLLHDLLFLLLLEKLKLGNRVVGKQVA